METKPLLYGLIGFFIGGFIVSLAATTFDKPAHDEAGGTHAAASSNMEMSADSLLGKTGDEYDAAFISEMIAHHEGAVAMAKMSAAHAKHDEIKRLSLDIISSQAAEITQMKQWQKAWHYTGSSGSGANLNHDAPPHGH